jgi:Spy/CpxP family protein refolding chaperone
MKRHLIIFTILALLVFGFTTVYAQPGQGPGMRGKGLARDSFPAFTKDQLQQMDQLRLENQKTMIPMRSDLKLLMVEYKDMLRTNASQSDLNAKLDQIGQLKIKISKARLDHRLKMRNIMTDEQREFMESHRGMGRGFFDGKGSHRGRMFDRMHRGDDRGWRGFRGDFDDEDDDGMMGHGFMGMHGDCAQNCPGPCMQQ